MKVKTSMKPATEYCVKYMTSHQTVVIIENDNDFSDVPNKMRKTISYYAPFFAQVP
jgi:uncharacterized protein YcgL (UPF0745 family)